MTLINPVKMISFKHILTLLLPLSTLGTYAQQADSVMIHNIYYEALGNHAAYTDLRYLTKNIGGRIIGSPQAARAVQFTQQLMVQKGLDSVYLQPTQVRHWVRGNKAECTVTSGKSGNSALHICALGGSVGTPGKGITAQVIEVDSLSDLAKLGKNKVEGKIVFFNRPMDPHYIRTFTAYGKAADQRVRGASEAARYGAIGVIVRSLTLADNISPHTGIMHYDTAYSSIPAISVATHDANLLHDDLINDPNLNLHMLINCSEGDKVSSDNVIGELKGSDKRDEVIVLGGHIDSWDLGEGAHDDGAGCMQSIEAVRILKALGYHPHHTIRCIMFMDEEMGQAGGRTYAAWSEETHQKHLAALEMDAGGFIPTGFSITANKDFYEAVLKWKSLFETYGIYSFTQGGGGVDISFLKNSGVPLIGLSTDSQRYFDYHHSALDVFEAVNEREMQMGSATVAALIYLLDQL